MCGEEAAFVKVNIFEIFFQFNDRKVLKHENTEMNLLGPPLCLLLYKKPITHTILRAIKLETIDFE